jgi:hypothetical protein
LQRVLEELWALDGSGGNIRNWGGAGWVLNLRHEVVVTSQDSHVLEALGRLNTRRVTDVAHAPLEGHVVVARVIRVGRLAGRHLLELDLNVVSRNTANDLVVWVLWSANRGLAAGIHRHLLGEGELKNITVHPWYGGRQRELVSVDVTVGSVVTDDWLQGEVTGLGGSDILVVADVDLGGTISVVGGDLERA